MVILVHVVTVLYKPRIRMYVLACFPLIHRNFPPSSRQGFPVSEVRLHANYSVGKCSDHRIIIFRPVCVSDEL